MSFEQAVNGTTALTQPAPIPQEPERSIYPINLVVDGRSFDIQLLDTRLVYKMYGRYESLLMSVVRSGQEDSGGIPLLEMHQADDMMELLFTVCELAKEKGVPVNMNTTFSPSSTTPLKLAPELIKRIFGPFLDGENRDNYQPVLMKLFSAFLPQT